MTITVGDLRKELAAKHARWTVHPWYKDDDPISPRYRLGALTPKKAAPKRRLDFHKFLATAPSNAMLAERRIFRGFLKAPKHAVVTPPVFKPAFKTTPDVLHFQGTAKDRALRHETKAQATEGAGAAAASVDWRNRWGWPWITTIRDQGGCEACWVFTAVALTEAMVRIEHSYWACLSEGDVHKGLGATCCQCGWVGGLHPGTTTALDWISGNGVADPGCFAWPVSVADGCACLGCDKTGGESYDKINYTPTLDRDGRTVRIPAKPAWTEIGNVDDQKAWIDTIGPVAATIRVYSDFTYFGTGIYEWQDTINGQPNTFLGLHCLTIVGYDDQNSCWIVKNSWGTGWGDQGFGRIGYGQCWIDYYVKTGLTGTNPDPLGASAVCIMASCTRATMASSIGTSRLSA